MRRWFRFPRRIKRSTSSIAVRPRRVPAGAALVVMAAWASLGCDSFSFVPPQPEELRGTGDLVPVAKSIELVLGPHEPDELEVWKSQARMQAGIDKVKLRIDDPAESSTTQADQVRAALTHLPAVLVVEFAGKADPPLMRAIDEAREKGIPVVLVGHRPDGDKPASGAAGEVKTKSTGSAARPAPLVLVTPQSFDVPAGQLVAAAIRSIQVAGLEPGKAAIFVVNDKGDSFAPGRVLALKNALKAVGITTIDEVRFTGDNKAAEKAVEASLQANPKTLLVLTFDSSTTSVLKEVIKADIDHRFVVAGCYTSEEFVGDLSRMVNVAAVAEFTPTRLLRKAISTAVSLAQKRDVPPVVEFRINVSESVASPATVKAQAIQWKEAKEAKEKAKK